MPGFPSRGDGPTGWPFSAKVAVKNARKKCDGAQESGDQPGVIAQEIVKVCRAIGRKALPDSCPSALSIVKPPPVRRLQLPESLSRPVPPDQSRREFGRPPVGRTKRSGESADIHSR